MESPVKKLDLGAVDKENQATDNSVATLAAAIDAKAAEQATVTVTTAQEKLAVAPGIKAHEADEPLLQENPQRFVLFPIKYHEVRVATRLPRVNGFPPHW